MYERLKIGDSGFAVVVIRGDQGRNDTTESVGVRNQRFPRFYRQAGEQRRDVTLR